MIFHIIDGFGIEKTEASSAEDAMSAYIPRMTYKQVYGSEPGPASPEEISRVVSVSVLTDGVKITKPRHCIATIYKSEDQENEWEWMR